MNEGKYLDALCNTADGVFITNKNKRIIRWNQGSEKILGYTELEALNHCCFQLISGRIEQEKAFCGQNCKIHCNGLKGFPQENFDLQTRTNKGKPLWLNVTILSSVDSEEPCVAHILRDITKGKKMELALDLFLADLEPSGTMPKRIPAEKPLNKHFADAHHLTLNQPSNPLSLREIEVLTLLAEGLTTKGLAQKLNISHFTARNHIQNILVKLNLHSKAQAVSYAFKRGIL